MNLSIGEKIKQLRRDNDVTQEKFADYLNISHQAISKWESGTTLPDVTMLVPIAKLHADIQDKEKAAEYYELAKKHALIYDTLPEGDSYYTSIFTDKIKHNIQQVSKSNPKTMSQQIEERGRALFEKS